MKRTSSEIVERAIVQAVADKSGAKASEEDIDELFESHYAKLPVLRCVTFFLRFAPIVAVLVIMMFGGPAFRYYLCVPLDGTLQRFAMALFELFVAGTSTLGGMATLILTLAVLIVDLLFTIKLAMIDKRFYKLIDSFECFQEEEED